MKTFFVLCFSLILFNCSKVEWGYKMAPRVLANRIDDAFDFNSDRFNQVRNQLEADFKSNQKELISMSVQQIDTLLALSDKKDLSKADLKNNFENLQAAQKKIIYLFRPTFEKILNQLSDEEFKNLKKYAEEKFAETNTFLTSKEALSEKQLKSFKDAMEFFFDQATDVQIGLYKTFAEKNYSFFVYQLSVRRDFMKNFELRLPDKKELIDYTLKYYSGDFSIRTDEHQKKQLAAAESFTDFEYQIWLSLTDKQKKYFKETLMSLKAEIERLSAT